MLNPMKKFWNSLVGLSLQLLTGTIIVSSMYDYYTGHLDKATYSLVMAVLLFLIDLRISMKAEAK